MSVFDDIYRTNAWGGTESLSGPGSTHESTALVSEWLTSKVDELGIESILDVGCGDCNWQPDFPGYMGMDVSKVALQAARRRWPKRLFVSGMRRADAVLCREVMQHLPLADGLDLLERIVNTGARYLFATTYRSGHNLDVKAGEHFHINLEDEPFDLLAPLDKCFDGQVNGEVRFSDRFLGLWDL